MIDLRSLEVYFWVVKLGGFSRAAERLHMTQPAVSSRVSQFEARFRVHLLDRSSHRAPVPTAKGLEVYALAERMLSLRGDLLTCLGEKTGLSGTVRIGTAETLVHTLVGKLIGELTRLHPQVTPEITVDITPMLHVALMAGELDVALLMGPINEPRIRNVALRDYELVWVASPSLDISADAHDLAEFARFPLLSYARGTQPHTELVRLFSRADLPAPRIFANSSLSSIHRMALDGVGIGALPDVLVAEDIVAGRLIELAAAPKLPPLRFTASYVATPGSGVAGLVAELAAEIAQSSNV